MAWTTPTVRISTVSLFAADSWTDVTDRVVQIRIQRGRSTEVDAYAAGTASITLRNDDRLLDPLNTSSALYPNLKPRNKIEVKDGANYLFVGYISDEPRATYDEMTQRGFCTLSAVDLLGVLATYRAPSASWWDAYPTRDSSVFWWFKASNTNELPNRAGAGTAAASGGYLSSRKIDIGPLPVGAVYELAQDNDPGRSASPVSRIYVDNALDDAVTSEQTPWSFETFCRVNFPPPTGSWEQVLIEGPAITITFGNSPGSYGDNPYLRATAASEVGGITNSTVQRAVHVGYPTNQYLHIVVTFDAPSISFKFYMNGLELTNEVYYATSGSWASSDDYTQSTAARIAGKWGLYNNGNQNLTAGQGYYGGFTNAVFYVNKVLSASDVQARYRAAYNYYGARLGSTISDVLTSVGIPSGLMAIDPGLAIKDQTGPQAGASLLAFLQSLAQAENGRLYVTKAGVITYRNANQLYTDTRSANVQATFAEGANLKYLDANPSKSLSRVYNEVTIGTNNGYEITKINTSSQSAHGPKGLSRTGLPLAGNEIATSLASWLLNRFGNPTASISDFTFDARAGASEMAYAYAVELGDRISVSRQPLDTGSTWTTQAWVETITHEINTVERKHIVKLGLSGIDSSYSLFTLDSSLLDGANVLGF